MRLWPRKRVYVDDLPRTHDLRFAALFVVGFLVLLGGLYAVGYVVAGNRLPAGTTVAGVDVGGMKRGEASTTLQSALAPRLQRRITATVLNKTFSLYPQRAGMTFDIQATIDSGLGGDSWDPGHILHVLSGGDPLQPVLVVNQHELNATLARIAAKVDRPAVNAAVSFASGLPQVTYAQEGTALDRARARRALQDALLSGDDQVRLPVESVDPKVSSTAAVDFVATVAKPAVNSPVAISVVHKTIVLQPQTFVPALRAVPTGKVLRLSFDASRLYARTHGRIEALPYHPVNARVVFRGGRPRVVPGRSGVTVEPPDWAAAVLRAAQKPGKTRHAVAKVRPDPPRFTTSQARMLRLRKPVGTAAVRPQRSADVAVVVRSAGELDGALLAPGDTFSFLRRVNSRQDPGASSVVASAVYRAALVAGMSDLQRTAAVSYSPAFPPGMDARVQPPAVDLQWRNSTPYGVYVRSWVSVGKRHAAVVHVQLWSSPYWTVTIRTSSRYQVTPPRVQRIATPGCRPRAGVAGFDVDVRRVSAHPDQPRMVETVHTSYSPVDRVVCGRPDHSSARARDSHSPRQPRDLARP